MKTQTDSRALIRTYGVSKLARALGVNRQAVQQWRRVPPMQVLKVELATGVRREVWRPDLYPKEG